MFRYIRRAKSIVEEVEEKSKSKGEIGLWTLGKTGQC